MSLIDELYEDAEYIDSYHGFVGSPDRISRNQRAAASEIDRLTARVAELEAERAKWTEAAIKQQTIAKRLTTRLEAATGVAAEDRQSGLVDDHYR